MVYFTYRKRLFKKIGILGGMGPEATAQFYRAIIKECQQKFGSKFDEDFPEIIILSLPVPDVVKGIENPKETLDCLIEGAKRLEAAGADFIAMPCNTATYFYDQIAKQVSIPFLSIIEEMAKRACMECDKKVGVIATKTSIGKKIFEKDFEKRGMEIIYPKRPEKTNQAILNIMAGKKLEKDRQELKATVGEMKKAGAEAIVLGCTELPLLVNEKFLGVRTFDSIQVLAEAATDFAIAKQPFKYDSGLKVGDSMAFKTVRGMRDFLPKQASKKQWIEETCKKVFERYGFGPLETPVVEEFALLGMKGGGGEAVRDEIYYFKDKSGRELGLRFDLTVPLARVVASNPQLPKPFKRYQIGRVYRYDRPGEKRYREFTQADFDIVGSSGAMADFEVIAVTIEVMKKLGFKKGEFKVKVNSRPLLEEVALCCNVEKGKVVDCFRCLDKLDKIGGRGVEKELREKGINTQILGQLEACKLDTLKMKNRAPLEEINRLLALIKKNGLDSFVEVDLSLARGLEYYTGMVFEVCVKGSPSVGGGGRYDKLVGLYGGQETACVGGSFGVDRLVSVMEGRMKAAIKTRLFVVPVGKEMQLPALELVQKIRAEGIDSSMDLNSRGISKNLDYANKIGIPFVAILGENELKKKEFSLKNMATGKEKKVKFADLKKLARLVE